MMYARQKMAGDLDSWMECNTAGPAGTYFNFKNFNFKVDGVKYFADSKKFRAAVDKERAWEILNGNPFKRGRMSIEQLKKAFNQASLDDEIFK